MPCESNSVDLVSAVQSCHWFDLPVFYTEVERVLKPGGVLALVGYDVSGPAPEVQNSKELNELITKVTFITYYLIT